MCLGGDNGGGDYFKVKVRQIKCGNSCSPQVWVTLILNPDNNKGYFWYCNTIS